MSTSIHPTPHIFRPAEEGDVERIVDMVREAQARLRGAGIDQWQNGYPNRGRIEEDLRLGYGRVVVAEGRVVAYGAVTYDGEPAYDHLEGGSWPIGGDYATVHRLCVAEDAVGRGWGVAFMELAEREAAGRVPSIRVDTHPDNRTMQHIVSRLGYAYCGVVWYESSRLAYIKLLRE
ncbi:MAG: GNAT family N-acetyltransferase [Tidjanibacter sp.]|nr:GNAT family N-acetyltransferase [Tidjanibacter sp.]